MALGIRWYIIILLTLWTSSIFSPQLIKVLPHPFSAQFQTSPIHFPIHPVVPPQLIILCFSKGALLRNSIVPALATQRGSGRYGQDCKECPDADVREAATDKPIFATQHPDA